jgi:hypothetical protein
MSLTRTNSWRAPGHPSKRRSLDHLSLHSNQTAQRAEAAGSATRRYRDDPAVAW